MPDRVWAMYDSLEGQLQRGRGLGFRSALGDPGTAGKLVLRCVLEDPRWDAQVEDRGLYYARLFRALDLPLDPISKHLATDPERPALALDVLECLARYGYDHAVGALRDYLESGSQWESALYRLVNVVPREQVDELHRLAAERGPERDLTDDLAVATARLSPDVERHWRERLRAGAALTTEDLLERAAREPSLHVRYARFLQEHSDVRARDVMLRAATEGADGARAAALIALGHLGDDRILDVCDELLGADASERVVRAAHRGASALRTERALEQGRGWAESSGPHAATGLALVAAIGSAQDLPLLHRTFAATSHEDGAHVLCDLAEALGRIADPSSATLLEQAYRQAIYSYLRIRCALALEKVSPEFGTTLAFESLWDCETTTRLAGCRSLDASRLPEAEPWLVEMSEDPNEDVELRAIATGRVRS